MVARRSAAESGHRRTAPPPWLRWGLRLALSGSVLLAGILTVAFVDANWRFSRLEAAAPVRLFSSPFLLTKGLALGRDDLTERLARLGYRQVEGHPQIPGEFSRRFRGYEIHLNAFDYPEGPAEALPVRVRLGFGRVSGLENLTTGDDLETVRIEPETLGTLSGDVHEERLPVATADLPRALLDAVVAVEDRRFYRHFGIDPKGVLRALFAKLYQYY